MASNPYRNESELIAACLAGDPAAWEHFIGRYRRYIRATVAQYRRRQAGGSTDTDDLESHVYQRLLEDDRRRIRAWQGRSKFSTYLVQVTRNLVMDYFALRNQRPLPESYQAQVESAHIDETAGDREVQQVRQQAFRAALETLPVKQALIIRLRLEGKTLKEISAITNRPSGTVAVENSRAMERIRAAMLYLTKQMECDE